MLGVIRYTAIYRKNTVSIVHVRARNFQRLLLFSSGFIVEYNKHYQVALLKPDGRMHKCLQQSRLHAVRALVNIDLELATEGGQCA